MTKCLKCKQDSDYLIKRIYYHKNEIIKENWVCAFCDQANSMLEFLKLKNKSPKTAKWLFETVKKIYKEEGAP